jgi:voltage-gated potassium channel
VSRDLLGDKPLEPGFRRTVYEIIFEADTPAGKWFDVLLIVSIIVSVVVVMLDSVASVNQRHGRLLYTMEWVFTVLFTAEYVLRLVSIRHPVRYAASFFGIVDLLSILPTYLSLFVPGSEYLLVIRVIRILRIFRVLKLVPYIGEADMLMRALWASRRKITVFLFAVLTLVIIFGSLMYVIEGEANGFTSIPRSIYWAVVTLTTVGYGDISPKTDVGQAVSAIIMVMGYGIIAVPTGIVTVELANAANSLFTGCPGCGANWHDADAVFCKRCGSSLEEGEPPPSGGASGGTTDKARAGRRRSVPL